MTALYLLAHEYRVAADALAELDLDDQTVSDTLDGLTGDLEVKAANVAMFARNLEATAAAIHSAEKAMAARRKAIEARADRLRAYILLCMKATGMKVIECPYFRIAVRDNPSAVDVFDLDQVPAAFMAASPPPPPTPDKTAIKAAIKAGQTVPGCRLTQGTRLEIC